MIKVQIRKDQISSRGLRQIRWENQHGTAALPPVHVARLREKSRKGIATC